MEYAQIARPTPIAAARSGQSCPSMPPKKVGCAMPELMTGNNVGGDHRSKQGIQANCRSRANGRGMLRWNYIKRCAMPELMIVS